MKKRIVKILKFIVNIYNTWYGVIDIILGFLLLSYVQNTFLLVSLIGVTAFNVYTWYKNIFKNFGTKKDLFATYRENNSLAVLGGIGSGKSTLANFLLTTFTPKHLRYYNTKNEGYRAFTNKHLLLKLKLEKDAGVLVDEAGAQADAYHYSKSDSATRKRIDFLNKFFRQWYGDKAHLIYVDQAQGNMNVSLYRNTYYVIQCKGVDKKPSSIILYLIAKFILFFINRKRKKIVDEKNKSIKNEKDKIEFFPINNPFTNVSIEFMEFVKLGEYADHYNITIEDKNHKKLVCSIYKLFGGLNTYVFREFNPAKEDKKPYIWGTSPRKDKKIMEDNFSLNEMKEDIKDTFLKT